MASYPIWHPFTQMQLEPAPIFIKKGKKEFLYDANENQIIDGISSWWTNIHGHAHPYIRKKVNEQAKKIEQVIFAGFTHKPAIKLSQRLLQLTHKNFDKVFFSDDGSTAIEVALKMAMQFHYHAHLNDLKNRPLKILSFENAYHGDTFAAMSVAGKNIFTLPFADYFFEVVQVRPPYLGEEKKSFKNFITTIEQNNFAAFIYEPLVQGAGGMLMHNEKALLDMIRFAKEKNIITIADEVMTGFGRTGTLFASEQVGEFPDLLCLSKGLTAGFLPMSVTLAHKKIYDSFLSNDRARAFFHGHSFTANPLACAAANASLDLFEKKNIFKKIKKIEKAHKEFINSLRQFNVVRNIRLQGTILAFDVQTPNAEGDSYLNQSRDFFYNYFLKNGVLLRPLGNTLYILPPYCISKKSLQKIYSLIIDMLNQFSNKTKEL